uniref:WSC domain-containing protein n=1 Tax=Noctiluca scintillans TaxID=2966 RepID=A0A7S1FC29_NOCSC|mmetsp:Transcript_48969/g.129727  ORF Transcript_48969/g.129727 Transcript_48969/m.129727 type:complete len:432 (+) Transcript_48969:73-1368(+)
MVRSTGVLTCALVGSVAGFSLRSHQSTKLERIPGFGIGETTVSSQPLKDGYVYVTCTEDALVKNGDKHGPGKFTFESSGNVSILWYSQLVEKLEQKPISPEVCYGFCRSIPDAGFFGLIHGRDCYCAPYFKTLPGDSSSCDEACAGDSTKMCGGKTKSAIYAMHACNSVKEELRKATDVAQEAAGFCSDLGASLTWNGLTEFGPSLKTRAGNAGDVITSAHAQAATVWAQDMTDASDEAVSLAHALSSKSNIADDNRDIVAIETDIAELKPVVELATEKCADMRETYVHPVFQGDASTYYPVTYWVEGDTASNKTDLAAASPSTCAGDQAADPLFVASYDECAAACDHHSATATGCVAFQFASIGGTTTNFCSLLSKITAVAHFTGGVCEGADAKLLCAGKFTKMGGLAQELYSKTAGVQRVALEELKRCF